MEKIMGSGVSNKKLFIYSNLLHVLLALIITAGLSAIVLAYLKILEGEQLSNIDSYAVVYSMLFLILLTLLIIDNINIKITSIRLLYLFALISFIPILLFSDSINTFFRAIVYSYTFILIFRYGYCLGCYDTLLTHKTNSLLAISMIVLIPLYIDGYILNYNTNFLVSNDAIFSLAVLTPLSILTKNKKISIFLLIIIIIITLFSLKRSVILGVVSSIVVGFLLIFNKREKSHVFFVIILTICLIYGGAMLNTNIGEALINRFYQDDNGRSDIQNNIISSFEKSSTLEILFGHGYDATLNITGQHAHNDLIEVLFNFGFFSALLYFILLFIFIQKCLIWYKYRQFFLEYYACFVMSVILLILLSSFNCILGSMYSCILYLLIGLSYGKIKSVINKSY